jgi:hypothetical protein
MKMTNKIEITVKEKFMFEINKNGIKEDKNEHGICDAEILIEKAYFDSYEFPVAMSCMVKYVEDNIFAEVKTLFRPKLNMRDKGRLRFTCYTSSGESRVNSVEEPLYLYELVGKIDRDSPPFTWTAKFCKKKP